MPGDFARSDRGCLASWSPYRLWLPCCARHAEDRAPGACWITRVDAKAFGLLFLADIAGRAFLRRMGCEGAHDWDAMGCERGSGDGGVLNGQRPVFCLGTPRGGFCKLVRLRD